MKNKEQILKNNRNHQNNIEKLHKTKKLSNPTENQLNNTQQN